MAVTVLVSAHAFCALFARPFFGLWQFFDSRKWIVDVTIRFSGTVTVVVRPSVGKSSHTIDTRWMIDVKVARVTRASFPTAFLANRPNRRKGAIRTLRTKMCIFFLVLKVKGILGTEIAFTWARFWVAKVAWVALSELIWMAPAHSNWLNLNCFKQDYKNLLRFQPP